MLRCLSAYVSSERVTFDRSGTYLPIECNGLSWHCLFAVSDVDEHPDTFLYE